MGILKLEKMAYDSLVKYMITELPVISKAIAQNHFLLYSYAWLSKEFGCTIDEYIDTFGNACIHYVEPDGIYILGYNNKCKSYLELNWAIAHELGHVEIQHLKNRPIIEKPLRTFEMEFEAETYTYTFLCPDIVLDSVGATTWLDICYLCCVPIEKAKDKERLLKTSLFRKIKYGKKRQLLTQFEEFIRKQNESPDFETEFAFEIFPYELYA